MGTLTTDHVTTKVIFQLEEGKDGTKHFQGCFANKNASHWGSVVKKVPRWHLEPCKNWNESVLYCSKQDSRIDGPWAFGLSIPEPPEEKYTFKLENFRPWQASIIELIAKEPDNRTINWFHDSIGKMGKTVLAKHICCNYNAIYVQGKAADIKSAIAVAAKKPKIVVFGLPRSSEDFVSYDAIESCKDGIFFSGKYESGMCLFKPPHILIFANFKPDMTKLSSDRWNVIDINPAPAFSAFSALYELPREDAADDYKSAHDSVAPGNVAWEGAIVPYIDLSQKSAAGEEPV